MSDILTAKDTRLLARLSASKGGVFGAATLRELLDIVFRQQVELATLDHEAQSAKYKYTCIAVAAYGLDSQEGISAKGLPADLLAECLVLRQQHDDAQAWREQENAEIVPMSKEQAEVFMFGDSRPDTYQHDETGPLTRGLAPSADGN